MFIEFKRPSHLISRRDIAQAETYRDELAAELAPTSAMGIIMLGGGKEAALDARNIARGIEIMSYGAVLSAARHEMDWLITSLGGAQRD